MDHTQSQSVAGAQGAASDAPVAGSTSSSPQISVACDEPLVRTILESIAVPVYFIGRDGRILYANAKSKEIPDASMSEGRALPLVEFEPLTIHPDGRPCRAEEYPAIECLRTAQPQPPKTIGIRDGHGGITWVTASAIPFRHPVSGQFQGVIATVIDISRSLEVERSLKQAEDSYRRLVNDAPDAMIVHRAGRIVLINVAGVRLWRGKSPLDFLGRDILDFVHPRARESVRMRMRAVMRGDTTPLMFHRIICLDGTTVGVEATAMPCVFEGEPGIQVILRDVTERTRAERQIRKQREILKAFFESLPVFVGIFDQHGRCHLVNRQWKRVIGWGKEMPMYELLRLCLEDAEEREAATLRYEAARPGWRDFRVRVRDGSIRDVSSATVQLSSGSRIVIGQDITRRKAAEQALRRNQAELEKRVDARTDELVRKNEELRVEIAERQKTEQVLQEKQRFLERMLNSHERDRQLVAYEIHDTFLQGVIGALMYLDAYYESRIPERAEEMMQLDTARTWLRTSIEEARRMISGLRPPIIDEQGIVAAIEYLISEMNDRGVNIEFVHEVRRPRFAPLLEAAIFRIVQEGLTNFLRHSESSRAIVKLVEGDTDLRLTVQDFGAGFDPERVSDRHFGLQGIKERARLLGGMAGIESAPGQGTTVAVTIPLLFEGRPLPS